MAVNKIETDGKSAQEACRTRNLNYKYPMADNPSLVDVEFEVSRGQTIALFGESGSGKSTLFSSISGLIPHYYRGGELTGEVYLFGKRISQTEFSELASFIGIVTQNFRDQLRSNTVAGSIAFPMENQNVPYDVMHKKVDELLRLLQIDDIKDKDVNELSGGQGQRAAIATMLAKAPEMMIFDDISSDLDPEGQRSVQEIIRYLKKNGTTILITDASNPRELVELADKNVVIENGRVVFEGEKDEILSDIDIAVKTGVYIPQVEFRKKKDCPKAIILEGVSYSYNGKYAVKEVVSGIANNSITGIIGHNGSGKTTLLKLIGGLYKPKDGQIIIDGKNPNKLNPGQRVKTVSYLPQSTEGIFFTDSVAKELKFTPDEIGVYTSVLPETVGLQGLEDAFPEFLSGGQRQKLAIGCALSSDPDVILFDEPTKGINQKERLGLANQLLELQKKGKTIVLVSHDFQLIGRVTQNLLVMDNGRLVKSGGTKEIMQDKDFFNELKMPLPW